MKLWELGVGAGAISRLVRVLAAETLTVAVEEPTVAEVLLALSHGQLGCSCVA